VKYRSDQYNKDDDDSHKKKRIQNRDTTLLSDTITDTKKNEVNIIEIHNDGVETTQKERKRWCVCV